MVDTKKKNIQLEAEIQLRYQELEEIWKLAKEERTLNDIVEEKLGIDTLLKH